MPVLMNKGSDPRQAAWLFYTDRETLDAFGNVAAQGRFDAGVLTVDNADLNAARKPSSEVPVYLAVVTLVPEDFDLAQLAETAEGAQGDEQDDAQPSDESAGENSDAERSEQEADPSLPYAPVPAPEGTRVLVGTTTAAAARSFIQPREVDGKPVATELPGLPMLVALIDHLRDHGGIPPYAIWHVDPQGILRMAPAKQLKPMAGNVIKCKL